MRKKVFLSKIGFVPKENRRLVLAKKAPRGVVVLRINEAGVKGVAWSKSKEGWEEGWTGPKIVLFGLPAFFEMDPLRG